MVSSKQKQRTRNAVRKMEALAFLLSQEVKGFKVRTSSTMFSAFIWGKLWDAGLIAKEEGPITSYWVLSANGRAQLNARLKRG